VWSLVYLFFFDKFFSFFAALFNYNAIKLFADGLSSLFVVMPSEGLLVLKDGSSFKKYRNILLLFFELYTENSDAEFEDFLSSKKQLLEVFIIEDFFVMKFITSYLSYLANFDYCFYSFVCRKRFFVESIFMFPFFFCLFLYLRAISSIFFW